MNTAIQNMYNNLGDIVRYLELKRQANNLRGKKEQEFVRLGFLMSEIKRDLLSSVEASLSSTGFVPWGTDGDFLYIEGRYAFLLSTGQSWESESLVSHGCGCCWTEVDEEDFHRVIRDRGVTHMVVKNNLVGRYMHEGDLITLEWEDTEIRPQKAMRAFPELFYAKELKFL